MTAARSVNHGGRHLSPDTGYLLVPYLPRNSIRQGVTKSPMVVPNDYISKFLKCGRCPVFRLDYNDGTPTGDAKSGGASGPCP